MQVFCRNCAHFYRTDSVYGECRINPPHTSLEVSLHVTTEATYRQQPQTYWPVTRHFDWCGQGRERGVNAADYFKGGALGARSLRQGEITTRMKERKEPVT